MVKLIVATHERLAEGFKKTLDYIAPTVKALITISAYIDNEPIGELIKNKINNIDKDEQIIILTDLVGGSVNQECAKLLGEYKIKLISGVNFPLLLSIALCEKRQVTDEMIRNLIVEAKEQIVFVNDMLKNNICDLEDE